MHYDVLLNIWDASTYFWTNPYLYSVLIGQFRKCIFIQCIFIQCIYIGNLNMKMENFGWSIYIHHFRIYVYCTEVTLYIVYIVYVFSSPCIILQCWGNHYSFYSIELSLHILKQLLLLLSCYRLGDAGKKRKHWISVWTPCWETHNIHSLHALPRITW